MFKKQISENKCTIAQGPSCFLLEGESYFENTELINEIINDIESKHNGKHINMPFIISNLERLKSSYLKRNDNKVNQTFQVSPKIQLNLLLNFESYDINTQYQDAFMPEEKVIKFNISELKLRTRGGKMRITQERVNGQPKKINKNVVPYGAYSIIEEGGKFNILN